MSTTEEKNALNELLVQGYSVEVRNPYGKTFQEKYKVSKDLTKNNRKVVIVNDDGEAIGAQG